jgi:hypothetical protein
MRQRARQLSPHKKYCRGSFVFGLRMIPALTSEATRIRFADAVGAVAAPLPAVGVKA